MKKRDAFNTLFDTGLSYDDYVRRSPKHEGRMQAHWDAIDGSIGNFSEIEKNRLNKPIKLLCISESWCGDCANAIPVIARLSLNFDQWKVKITSREAHDDIIIEHYLTAGRKKIPVIVFADEDGDEIIRWVERPTRSYRLLVELQNERLPKEEYIAKYRSIPELKAPSLSEEIMREILEFADHAISMNQILPVKKY
ncbi:MAG: thioredoxin family protein [Candidatus Kariarchaeaceae archaeon]